jgi:hypothetical protein
MIIKACLRKQPFLGRFGEFGELFESKERLLSDEKCRPTVYMDSANIDGVEELCDDAVFRVGDGCSREFRVGTGCAREVERHP